MALINLLRDAGDAIIIIAAGVLLADMVRFAYKWVNGKLRK